MKHTLLGIEEIPFECSVGYVYIKDDYSTVQFSDFKANKPLLLGNNKDGFKDFEEAY